MNETRRKPPSLCDKISPVVIVPKSDGDIRLCVDLRRVNEAIIRERQRIPTIEEIMQDMSQSRVFSKVDLKWGYHQVELEPDSRNLTTFITHTGLYRYKRMPFGISAVSEVYQRLVRNVLQGIPGVVNLSDDTGIHTPDVATHYKVLTQLFKRLRDSGLTANADKIQLFVTEMTFAGHKLQDKGINVTAEKVQAVLEAREPGTVTDLVYWGLTPQQQPGSYQGGEMMMMKSVVWWRKLEYPEETTDLRQVDRSWEFSGISELLRKIYSKSGDSGRTTKEANQKK